VGIVDIIDANGIIQGFGNRRGACVEGRNRCMKCRMYAFGLVFKGVRLQRNANTNGGNESNQ
jgi:hypothetical protein